jgi:cytochrome c-type biogenesis protein CcmH
MKKFLFLLLFSFSALALSPETHLENEAQEARAMKLFLQVRCLVCEGQAIESSATEFSFEMRKLIRKKISEEKSDDEIKAELVKEFGNDILLEPSSKNFSGLVLQILPIIFATAFGVIFFLKIRK